ncbi:CoA transferase [Nakamurella antarctica]|uniref:CoA transferase n=1 Tax=Nakamurella antarctica TaxID=1902245 RepID=A0A3G8ZR86_9ACTN|nr:CoA transferase [Nakamurella antarctica]
MRPLDGLVVLDLSQFLAGPTAAARLADLGACVIKVERYPDGDPSRAMVVAKDMDSGGDSLIFHAINRGKTSLLVNLKSAEGLSRVRELISTADVLIESYRPGVMERLGLSVEQVHELNPSLVYGRITGYGSEGPWTGRPGQDLLVQALSGLCWLQGVDGSDPTPIGFSIVDAAAGSALTQGILAALLRRARGLSVGGLVEVSLLESAIDLQFEVLTLHLNQKALEQPPRSAVNPAHPYLAAPYGIYRCSDGWLAVAMGGVDALGKCLGDAYLAQLNDSKVWWSERDTIKRRVGEVLVEFRVQDALNRLLEAGLWASEVLGWNELVQHPGFEALDLLQKLVREDGTSVTTTRCPYRIDGQVLTAPLPAPVLGSAGTID